MTNIFKIHPSIGISRLGDSTTDFCLAPETPMGLPVKCDNQGRAILDAQGDEQPIDMFKDSQGRIKRQAARFRVYVYQDANDKIGRELKVGDKVEVYKKLTGKVYHAIVLDIEWTVHLANKKSNWYEFKDWAAQHNNVTNSPLRNASIQDPTARQRLIIDPGPQTVSYSHSAPRRAEFGKDKNPSHPQSFPPVLKPQNIETLGATIVHQQNDHNRLIVLGGYGNSGSFKTNPNDSRIASLANSDGWFDDTSDGPVTAKLWLQHLLDDGGEEDDMSPFMVPVDDPAWVLVAYPGYVPEIENMITLDDVVYDLSLRKMDYDPEIYGPLPDASLPSAESKDWNKEYHPYFYRDIWPILRRPSVYQWLMVFDPNNNGDQHGNFDLDVIAVPDDEGQDPAQRKANAAQRQYIYGILRRPGPENLFRASDKNKNNNQPAANSALEEAPAPSKFLRLTDTQLFFLQQWVDGKFINEKHKGLLPQIDHTPFSGSDLDHNVLRNAIGGAFCIGKEICWLICNPAIYAKPYRIKHAPYEIGALSYPSATTETDTITSLNPLGLEPGDLTKYGALPWIIDFNESTSNEIDITYEGWANNHLINLPAPTDVERGAFWWAARRPMEVFLPMSTPFGSVAKNQVPWIHKTAQNETDDSQKVTAWVTFGFVQDASSFESLDLIDAEGNLVLISADRTLFEQH